ncbi:hypothetical protein CS022_06805 [Veronia nyctiphanis]|uniref:Iron-binding zinc finger CDGSH type domain-containing protein n=1 Tax=Veronia nyctiphanis TaxID=1278244 RepID=A0A4Q0YS64_9GAMM|nr:CDGSH iron-sulfur domain-containing protein [Veronia nyctiphanis]RXJ73976.1 hypothetical protein CS022_06805 [Veronia nyctiphanis]
MSKPIVADNKSVRVDLVQGNDYYFCACGRSKSQPFCDGSHTGTSLSPLHFKAERTGPAFLCQCKATGRAPFCDGSHSRYTEDQIGGEI